MDAVEYSPGFELPVFVRKTGFAHWNRYAAVNDEFVVMHMDDEAAKAAGFPKAIGMGNLLWTYLHNLLRDWAGSEGRIETISAQYQQPNLRDSTITVHGRIAQVQKEPGATRVSIELWIDDEENRKLATGQAALKFPK